MHQDKDILRLINCLAGSFILHVFILSFSQQVFWNPAGNSRYTSQALFHPPLTVTLAPKEPPLSIALPAVPDATDRSHLLMTQQIAKPSSVDSPSPKNSPASTYHATQELTRIPELIVQPPQAIEVGQGTSGEVVFKLSINRFGKVTLLQQLKSSLPRDVEGKLAMQLYRSEYRPGEINGLAVDSEMTVDLNLDSGKWLSDKLPVLRPAISQEKP